MRLRKHYARPISRTREYLKRNLIIPVMLVVAACAVVGWLMLGRPGFLRSGAGVKWKELTLPESGKTGFTLLHSDQTGISFMNSFKDEQLTSNQLLFTGSGVAAGDFDKDGLCDLYFCKLDGANALYKNLGNWRFEDVTAKAGVGLAEKFSTGATFADIDGDNDLDLLVSGFAGMTAFRNEGNGRFTDATKLTGLTSELSSTTLTLADIEGDGDLDLYVANYRTTTLRDGGAIPLERVNGQIVIPPGLKDRITFVDGALKEYGEPDILYRNDGKGHFTPVSWTDGTFLDEDGLKLTGPPLDWGLTATFRDVDLDGDPDLYVCNDYWTPERFWINDGTGRFRAIERLALRHTCATSMGVDFADLDRDGDYDFLVTDMLSRDQQLAKLQMPNMKPKLTAIGKIDDRPQYMRNTLFLNRGDSTYAEIAEFAGLEASEWSWSPVFFDIDLDGFEDVIIPNGNARDVQDYDTINHIKTLNLPTVEQMQRTLLLYPPLNSANLAFRNLGNLRFEDVSQAWGVDSRTVSQGMATADLDNDGDLDFVLNNHQVPAGVYRNETDAPRVAVRLIGSDLNTGAVGARVSLMGGPVPTQFQEVICGGRYLSGSEPLLTFAAGTNSGALSLEVTWRSGHKSLVTDVIPNRIYEVSEGSAGSARSLAIQPVRPIFEDVSALIRHTHHENEFDDFLRQPLLPRRLSRLGPGVGWHDLNGDGWDDLIIGAGKDGSTAVYLNNANGSFSFFSVFAQASPRDQTSILAWTSTTGSSSLMTGLSNFEDGLLTGESALSVDFTGGRANFGGGVPVQPSSSGPMALADIDADGDLDVFVGGRSVPGRYPVSASSMLYLNQNRALEPDHTNNIELGSIGMVSGAVFSDIDSDGDADLILAIEWGAVTVLVNQDGRFSDVTDNLGLSKYTGWWNGVTTGDLDGDGRLDIVATNWGLNSTYRNNPSHPLRVYYDDFDGNGTLDPVEAVYDPRMGKYVPRRGLEAMGSIPMINAKFATFRAYASAGMAEVFGPAIDSVPKCSVSELRHMMFMNRGDHFEAVPLPTEAQLAPASGVSVGDYDGDGHEDIFIAQNFFATNIDAPRSDGGRGLWLKGDGRGGVEAIGGQETGVKVNGDARGSALGDFDGDGRTDLVVTQNGGQTVLYRNVGGEPGLRVKLLGPPGNLNGVGATLRMVYGQQNAAAREVHAGSGYWSQDSAVQVVRNQGATGLWVRWPGGKVTSSPLPSGAKEIRVDTDGKVSVIR